MIRKIISFIVSNFLGTLVDTAVLWVCSHLFFTTYFGQYVLSPLISFECAVFVNFICSYFYIWRGRIDRDKSRAFLKYYAKYNASCTGGFFLKMVFLLITERLFHTFGVSDNVMLLGIVIPLVVLCNLIALCFSGVFNFVMGEWVVFRKKTEKRNAPDPQE